MAIVIGCDFHSRFQQLAILDTATGEIEEKRLEHAGDEVETFYRQVSSGTVVAMEATGFAVWFDQLLGKLGVQLVIGDAAKLRAMAPRKQKTDRRDAELLAVVYARGDFPKVWLASPEQRDLRQLLWHRHRLVGMRTRLKNSLHALAMNHRICKKSALFSVKGRRVLAGLELMPYEQRRRDELLELLGLLEPKIAAHDRQLLSLAESSAEAQRLMTHTGVGPITALAWCTVMGDITRFPDSGKVCSYLGLIPEEESSAAKRRLGHLTKQGNGFMRFLLVEAAQTAACYDAKLGACYRRLAAHRGRSIAKVAVTRKLAVRLFWMSVRSVDYSGLSGQHTQTSSRGPLA